MIDVQAQLRLTILDGCGNGGVALKYKLTFPFSPIARDTIMIDDWQVNVGHVTYRRHSNQWYLVIVCATIDDATRSQSEIINEWKKRGWIEDERR